MSGRKQGGRLYLKVPPEAQSCWGGEMWSLCCPSALDAGPRGFQNHFDIYIILFYWGWACHIAYVDVGGQPVGVQDPPSIMWHQLLF